MSSSDFDYLFSIVGPSIAKQNTCMRDAFPAGERLAITLRYLASGKNFKYKYLPFYLLTYLFNLHLLKYIYFLVDTYLK